MVIIRDPDSVAEASRVRIRDKFKRVLAYIGA